jgi:hypothetical protein
MKATTIAVFAATALCTLDASPCWAAPGEDNERPGSRSADQESEASEEVSTATGEERYSPERYHVADNAHVLYTLYPNMSTQLSSTTPASLASLAGSLHELDAKLIYPVVLNSGKTIVLVGFDYTYTGYQLTGLMNATLQTASGTDTVTFSPVPQNLHAVSVVVGLSQALTRTWSAAVTLKPGIYSDFRVWDGAAVFAQGAATFTYRPSRSFALGFGVSYQSKFGTALVLPVLDINWYMGKGFRLVANLPEAIQLVAVPHDRIAISLFGRVKGGAYRIHPTAALNHTDATGMTTTSTVPFAYDLSYSTIALGVGLRVRLSGGLWLATEAPLALNRKWDGTNLCYDNGNNQTLCNNGPSSVNLANVGSKLSVGFTGGFEYRY